MIAGRLAELHRIGREIRELENRLRVFHLNPAIELENIMSALDQLKSYPAQIDQVTGSLSTDIAGVVAAATAPLTAQITSLQAAATQTETDTQAVADAIGASIGKLQVAAGVTAPAAPPAAAAVSGADPAQQPT